MCSLYIHTYVCTDISHSTYSLIHCHPDTHTGSNMYETAGTMWPQGRVSKSVREYCTVQKYRTASSSAAEILAARAAHILVQFQIR